MNKTQLIQSLSKYKFPQKILDAFEKVNREDFLPEELKSEAYQDIAMPIGYNQTISQPHTISLMLQLLNPKENQKILEIGSGSGYVLALLSQIVGNNGKVFGVELIKELTEESKNNLENYSNVEVYNKNGKDGLKEKAPFDRILISAAILEKPNAILEQLKDKGILVAPISFHQTIQTLTSIQRNKQEFNILKQIPGFVFVPFVNN